MSIGWGVPTRILPAKWRRGMQSLLLGTFAAWRDDKNTDWFGHPWDHNLLSDLCKYTVFYLSIYIPRTQLPPFYGRQTFQNMSRLGSIGMYIHLDLPVRFLLFLNLWVEKRTNCTAQTFQLRTGFTRRSITVAATIGWLAIGQKNWPSRTMFFVFVFFCNASIWVWSKHDRCHTCSLKWVV